MSAFTVVCMIYLIIKIILGVRALFRKRGRRRE